MKAIISHDIDHLTAWEHFGRDLIIPKFMLRSKIELLSGKISLREFFLRGGDFFSNKWQNINELADFNATQKIPSSFFIGVQNGLGLSYPLAASEMWIKQLLAKGCEVGVHGIAFESFEKIKQEHALFQSVSGLNVFGTRMHYVRTNKDTFGNMDKAGYVYDSSENAFKDPYRIGNMWEFPFQLMDSWEIEAGKRWQSRKLEAAKDSGKRTIEKAFEDKLEYLGVIFHDRYFSKSFQTWMDWYTWLTGYLAENKITFVNFHQAVEALNTGQAK